MSRILMPENLPHLVHPVNPVKKLFLMLRVTLWMVISLTSAAFSVRRQV
jgi:hypothetical protein